MTINVLRMSFEEDVDDSSDAVIVICLSFLFREMNFIIFNSVFLTFINLYFELLSEEEAVWFCSDCVFLDDCPELSVLEKSFPF